jgi:pimeloyl-ACP methyl ester carboxylesterase
MRDRRRMLAVGLGDTRNAARLGSARARIAVPPAFARGAGRPVVLVPGVFETWHYLRAIAQRLNDAGHPVHVVAALGRNDRPIPESAARVAALLVERDLTGVALVAHSKGGLIGKQLMVHDDPDCRVDRLVAVATPFGGSRLARWMPGAALRAFRPAHPVIRSLAAERQVNARITSIAPAFDPHIPEGSHLDGAVNVELPVVGHFRVLLDPAVVDAVVAAVERGDGADG